MHQSPHHHSGKINSLWLLLLGGTCAVLLLLGLLFLGGPGGAEEADTLTVYCAAGMMVPVEEIAEAYHDEYGVQIEFQFRGSNDLLNSLQIDKFNTTDLYLAADDFYTDKAVELGLAAETIPIAHQRPVIVVPRDNPKGIETIDDLLRDDVRVVCANPGGAAVGRAVKKRLEQIKRGDETLWAKLDARITADGVYKPTVNEVATDVKLGGSVDAGIVWDSTAAMPNYRDHLKPIGSPALDGDPNLVSIAVLHSSKNATAALKFARFVAARDKGLPVFRKYGTRPVEGDVWAERPQINFYCGAVNRRAVEDIVEDFSQREDVVVNTSYDGCGILTSRMETFADQSPALGFPDAYMACDEYYLENVRQWFQDTAEVSDVEIVIAVPKDSDKVQSVDDLVKPGVIVALGEPDACTIGALTRRILQKEELWDALQEKKNKEGSVEVVEKASSALLVPDVTTGTADAAVAYITDVLANEDQLDIVRIESPLNKAVQPWAVAKTSDHKHLVNRLRRQIAANEEAFERVGFNFRLDDKASDGDVPSTEDAAQ